MAHIKVVIDGKTEMNQDIGRWTEEPPKLVKDNLKPNGRPSPWMRKILDEIADAGMPKIPGTTAGLSRTLTVTTDTDGLLTVNRYTLDVQYKDR